MPNIYVIAGCNGAGKTTCAFSILPDILTTNEFVNADLIAKGISPFNESSVSFEAGRDIVAYVDGYQKYFHLFYKGQIAQVDVNVPESYKVGFGNMAYIDYDGNFRVFSNGSTRRLISQRPDFYEVKGNMIVYGYNSEFRSFANGESVLIDDIMPKEYKLSNDGVAYLDVNGMLKFYYQGKVTLISHETPAKYFIYNDVVLYLLGTNTWKVWWNGNNY